MVAWTAASQWRNRHSHHCVSPLLDTCVRGGVQGGAQMLARRMAAALVCGLLIVPIVGAGTLIAAGTAGASSHNTVCANGCAFTSIQAAINAVSPGATITIGAGKYYENVVVSKSVTLQRSRNRTA